MLENSSESKIEAEVAEILFIWDLLLFRLLGEKDGLDVGQDTTLCDGDSREKFNSSLLRIAS